MLCERTKMNYNRQAGIIRQDELSPITVIGCGGIGSPTAIIAAKMGVPEIMLFDDDHVEDHNLPSQFYFLEDNGQQKAKALAETIKALADTKVHVECNRVSAETVLGGIVVS